MPKNQKIELLENGTIMYNGTEYVPLQPTKPEKPKSNVLFVVEKPEIGTHYWYIMGDGNLYMSTWQETTTFGIDCFNLNNVFVSDENAQKQADRNKLLAEIERFAVENNDLIDWSDEETDKYYLYYSHRKSLLSEIRWYVGTDSFCQRLGLTYFSSETIATQALEKFKDRLDILLD